MTGEETTNTSFEIRKDGGGMLRRYWNFAVLVFLTTTGLSLGQMLPPPDQLPDPKPTLISVREMDGPEQKCRLLRLWTNEEGQKTYLVEVLDTREKLTIVEGRPGRSPGKGISVRIYHWGNRVTSPPGVPLPPGEAVQAPSTPVLAKVEPNSFPVKIATPAAFQLPQSPPDSLLKEEVRRMAGEIRNPKSETRNPKSEIRNPKPETRNPKPETRNPNSGSGNSDLEFGISTPVLHPSSPPFGYYPTQWRPWPGTPGPGLYPPK